jgi:RNA polymerase sigma factor for flagellar operon FliA
MGNISRTYGAQARQNRREELLHAHLALVKHLVGKLALELPEGVALEPLEAAGLIGLIDAVAKYDPQTDPDFARFAREKITQAILDALKRDGNWLTEHLERIETIRRQYPLLAAPVDLDSIAVACAFSAESLLDSLIALRLLHRLQSPESGEPIRFEAAEEAAAQWVRGRLSASENPLGSIFLTLPTSTTRLLTLAFKEDLRLQEMSEILRLPQVETKRMYRRALWGIGESLRIVK